MKVVYQGQIGAVAGLTEEEIQTEANQTIASVIQQIAAAKSAEVAKFLVDQDGEVRGSLFVAVDGTHQQDLSAVLGEASELLLMPPMAGG